MNQTQTMNQAQKIFGAPSGRVASKIKDHLDAGMQDFIQKAPFVVLSTSNQAGDCDSSPKGGKPGFVKVVDDHHLFLPDIAGNKLFQSFENLETNPKAGLLFFIPGSDWMVRVNGRVTIARDGEGNGAGEGGTALGDVPLEVFDPDDNARVLQGLVIEVSEAYAHCPRALTFSALWHEETIAKNRSVFTTKYWMDKWFPKREKVAG